MASLGVPPLYHMHRGFKSLLNASNPYALWRLQCCFSKSQSTFGELKIEELHDDEVPPSSSYLDNQPDLADYACQSCGANRCQRCANRCVRCASCKKAYKVSIFCMVVLIVVVQCKATSPCGVAQHPRTLRQGLQGKHFLHGSPVRSCAVLSNLTMRRSAAPTNLAKRLTRESISAW